MLAPLVGSAPLSPTITISLHEPTINAILPCLHQPSSPTSTATISTYTPGRSCRSYRRFHPSRPTSPPQSAAATTITPPPPLTSSVHCSAITIAPRRRLQSPSPPPPALPIPSTAAIRTPSSMPSQVQRPPPLLPSLNQSSTPPPSPLHPCPSSSPPWPPSVSAITTLPFLHPRPETVVLHRHHPSITFPASGDPTTSFLSAFAFRPYLGAEFALTPFPGSAEPCLLRTYPLNLSNLIPP